MRQFAPRLFAMLVLLPSVVAAQPFTEKIDVSIVNVDVTVTDGHGNAVRGLIRDDFEVLEDGAPQPITNFSAVDHTAEPAEVDARFRRRLLVLIDTVSTTPFERDRAIQRLEELLEQHFRDGEYDWSIAAAGVELRFLLPPTADKAAIHRALELIRGDHAPPLLDTTTAPTPVTTLDAFASRVQAAITEQAAEEHFDAVIDAVRAFSATSGRKIILFVGGKLLPGEGTGGGSGGRLPWERMQSAIKQFSISRDLLIREANAANVSVFIVNPGGVAGDSSMYWVARETGGRLEAGNDLVASFRRFDADAGNFYSLGYRSPHGDDGKYHRIAVRVKGGAYALQYRDGYASLSDDRQLDRAMRSPFGAFMSEGSAIRPSMAFDSPRPVEDGVEVTFRITVPAEQLMFVPDANGARVAHVELSISIFDAVGRNVWFVRLNRDATLHPDEATNGTFVEPTEKQFAKGQPYRMVVAVRDLTSNAVGVVQEIVRY